MSHWSLARALAAFADTLRAHGVTVSPAESADALRALACIQPADEAAFAAVLRACLAKTPRDRERFEAAYHAFWHAGFTEPARVIEDDDADPDNDPDNDDNESAEAAGAAQPAPATDDAPRQDSDGPNHGASSQRQRMRSDLGLIAPAERDAMYALIRTLGRQLARRAARRWRARAHGTLDMRASLRRAIARGGELFELRRRQRRRARPRLVVFADVSYSMDAYSQFFLCFAHAFGQVFRSVESFVFSTRLSRVTDVLARGRLENAIAALPGHVADWAGGTRIASTIETYLGRYADRQLDRNTVVMIVSDGWDTDTPQRLQAALAQLRARCGAIIWLDPLMGHPGYFASALGCQHRTPAVDICVPARNLDQLTTLAERLSRQRLI